MCNLKAAASKCILIYSFVNNQKIIIPLPYYALNDTTQTTYNYSYETIVNGQGDMVTV